MNLATVVRTAVPGMRISRFAALCGLSRQVFYRSSVSASVLRRVAAQLNWAPSRLMRALEGKTK